jgi:ABC-type transporter Mla subunit MlaD
VIRATFRGSRVINVRQGAEVDLAGVWVGNVGHVELVDKENPGKGLVAELWIDEKYDVPVGSAAEVIVPLMGQPVLNISPPSPLAGPGRPLPRDGSGEIEGKVVNPLETVIDPKLVATLDKTTQQFGNLAAALTPAAQAMGTLLQPRSIAELESPEAKIKGVTANLSTAVERLYRVLTHFDTVLGDPAVQSNLKVTLDNLRVASESAKLAVADLQQFGAQAKEVANMARGTMVKVDQTVVITRDHIDALGRKLLADTDKLSRVLDSFVAIGESLARGEGTVGLLLRDPKLYEELLLTFQRLGAAAADMQVLVKQWQAQGIGLKLK